MEHMNKSDSGFKNRLDGRTLSSWRTTPFLTGLSLIGVSVLTLGLGLILFVWGVPYTAWKLAVLLKLWLSGTALGKKAQKYSTPSVRDD